MIVTVTDVVRDEGTVVVFVGTDESGRRVTFAADHRQAEDIADGLTAQLLDLTDIGDPGAEDLGLVVEVEAWQVLRTEVTS